MSNEPKQTYLISNERHWENRTVSIDRKTGLIKEIYYWSEGNEVEFVQGIGTFSNIGITRKRDWWLKKYIDNNKTRMERHILAGLAEAKKLLQEDWVKL